MGRQCGTSIRKSWVFRSSVWLCLMTKASTSALERSSHCAPSATIKSGACSAISESSSSTASAIRKQSGVATSIMPEAARRASCCGLGNWSALPSTGSTRLLQPCERQPRLRLYPGRAQNPHPRRLGAPARRRNQGGLADARLPRTNSAAPRSGTRSSSSSSIANSHSWPRIWSPAAPPCVTMGGADITTKIIGASPTATPIRSHSTQVTDARSQDRTSSLRQQASASPRSATTRWPSS
jgi:hypothetical protein